MATELAGRPHRGAPVSDTELTEQASARVEAVKAARAAKDSGDLATADAVIALASSVLETAKAAPASEGEGEPSAKAQAAMAALRLSEIAERALGDAPADLPAAEQGPVSHHLAHAYEELKAAGTTIADADNAQAKQVLALAQTLYGTAYTAYGAGTYDAAMKAAMPIRELTDTALMLAGEAPDGPRGGGPGGPGGFGGPGGGRGHGPGGEGPRGGGPGGPGGDGPRGGGPGGPGGEGPRGGGPGGFGRGEGPRAGGPGGARPDDAEVVEVPAPSF